MTKKVTVYSEHASIQCLCGAGHRGTRKQVDAWADRHERTCKYVASTYQPDVSMWQFGPNAAERSATMAQTSGVFPALTKSGKRIGGKKGGKRGC